MKILITGVAGFIGHALVSTLFTGDYEIVGCDNMNDYYDKNLKLARLKDIGIDFDEEKLGFIHSKKYPLFKFLKLDITDKEALNELFSTERPDYVCNLAAQAGVRYSLMNPDSYIQSNIVGFMNILEACRNYPVKHLLYASSSSIYGRTTKAPYLESAKTDKPVSLYAATKKSGELMAYCYSQLYNIPTTGLRFFTVYGPWGRPDMAPYIFLKAAIEGKTVKVFNNGKMKRDFTYIDDIVGGIINILPSPPVFEIPYEIYNIGNSKPVDLSEFIDVIEEVSHKKLYREYVGMQAGDVTLTYADVTKLQKDFDYKPKVELREGMQNFYDWYIKFTMSNRVKNDL